ncbi:ankyrin repeat and SOCS box protein 10 isoform X1 [Salmo salar]|uniref:Ankyrin repeat and SOCS box protein 10 isoform X1 n=1 Tax=Salmo salar TaxID=8030 RepID=A0A1S3R2Q7_SALSA|nr:ankyrin repeat and SOCS box protein 10 isoform X1 [Salmo salar]|eukprot:XP_014046643.1 PREDICTED: ankyrin repeat and SOCS box protein 10 isoform X1 [Salmo salar]
MSGGGSFVFTPMALRSLQLDEDMLERDKYKKQLASHQLNGYMLKKEARDRVGPAPMRSCTYVRPPAVCHDLVIQNAIYTGDTDAVQRFFPRGVTSNLIIEPQGGDMRWVARGEGLWSLTYEQQLTTPLHITAGRGFVDCLRHLLQRGASVDLAPGGTTALHEACQNGQPQCVKLLLSHGANSNAISEDGLMPLHMCTSPESLVCAKHLLQFGAAINGRSLNEDNTPLHVAAQNGLPGHTELYLHYGAALEKRNDDGLTPLNAACSQPQEKDDLERYTKVCELLLATGADVNTEDQDKQSPLHMACKNVNPDVVDRLLAHGACVNTMCYSGNAPMQNVLKVVAYKAEHKPERVVRSLLNHGSIRVWPGALPEVLKYCCVSPRTIEVLLNAYDRLKVTDDWVEAVSPEMFKEHKGFYESVFSLQQTPRSLQHLARWKFRNYLDGRVHKVVPQLDLPTFIKNFLLLEFRDYVH